MTHPMTDERLAELRKLANLTDQEDHWWALHNETELEAFTIDDFRSLLARLDAAEDLLREVAHCCTNPEFYDARVKWSSVQIGNDTIAQVRSYLR